MELIFRKGFLIIGPIGCSGKQFNQLHNRPEKAVSQVVNKATTGCSQTSVERAQLLLHMILLSNSKYLMRYIIIRTKNNCENGRKTAYYKEDIYFCKLEADTLCK